MEWSTRKSILAVAFAGLLSGAVAEAAVRLGVPGNVALVAGLAIVAPAVAFVSTASAGRFDSDAYRRQRGSSGMALDAGVSVVAGGVSGVLALLVLLAVGLADPFASLVAASTTLFVGYVAFVVRNQAFYRDSEGWLVGRLSDREN